MSGLAKILKNMGHDIKGSDIEYKKDNKRTRGFRNRSIYWSRSWEYRKL